MFGKYKKFNIASFIILILSAIPSNSSENLEGVYLEIKILDKVSSKNTTLTLNIGEEKKISKFTY